MSREGQLVADTHIDDLKSRFAALPQPMRNIIREIADEAGGDIAMNPPTERRVGIARLLLEIAENDATIDKDLVRSICELRTGKKYNTAGAGLSDLTWMDAERCWANIERVYDGRALLEYVPVSNHYIIKEKK
jgi:hypothetical protein